MRLIHHPCVQTSCENLATLFITIYDVCLTVLTEIMNKIDKTVQKLFMQVMQTDAFTLRLEAKSVGEEY